MAAVRPQLYDDEGRDAGDDDEHAGHDAQGRRVFVEPDDAQDDAERDAQHEADVRQSRAGGRLAEAE